MYIKFSLILTLFLSVVSCTNKSKNKLIVYPEYCQGCILRNFAALKDSDYVINFDVYFDTTDLNLVEIAKKNKIPYHHIDNSEIAVKFGDFANLVVINEVGNKYELKTNETLTRGIHFAK